MSAVQQMIEHSAAHFEFQPEPMTAQMRVVCAWCKADQGTKPCIEKMAGQISHGCCEACQDLFLQGANCA